MEFTPDVIVTAPDSRGVSLVAETKAGGKADLGQVEQQLKSYMQRMSCPVGLIITPTRLRIYKDRFLDRSEGSIELVGDFSSQGLFPVDAHRTTEASLESALVEWLDELAHSGHARIGDHKLNVAVSQYVVPAVIGGSVSIAHPGAR